MTKNNLKTTIIVFSMLLCFCIFAQGPPGGGQGGRNGDQGRVQQGGGKPDAAKILDMLDKDSNEKSV